MEDKENEKIPPLNLDINKNKERNEIINLEDEEENEKKNQTK